MKPPRSDEVLRRAPRGRDNPTVFASEEYPDRVVESESQDSFAADISDLSMDESSRGNGEAWWEKPSDESDDASWVQKLSNAPPLMRQPIKLAVKSTEPRNASAARRSEVRGGQNAREMAYRFPERSEDKHKQERRRSEENAAPKTSDLNAENPEVSSYRLSGEEQDSEDGACSYTEGAVARLSSFYERLSNVPPLMDKTLMTLSQKADAPASNAGTSGSPPGDAEATLPDATDEQWRWVQATVLEPDGPLHEPMVSCLAHVVSTESLSLDTRQDGTVTPRDVFLTSMKDLRDMVAGLLDRLLNYLRDRVTLHCKAEAPSEVEKKLSLDVVCFLNAMSSLDLALSGEDGNDSYREQPLYIPEQPETKARTDMNILERMMTKLHPKTVQEQYAETCAQRNDSGHHKKRSLLSEYAVWLKAKEKASHNRDISQKTHGRQAHKFPSLSYIIDKIRGRAKEADDVEMGTVDPQSEGEEEKLETETEKMMRRALEEERRLTGLLRKLMAEMKEDVRVDPLRTSSDLSTWSTSSVISLNSQISTLAAKMVEEVCVALAHCHSSGSASRGSVTSEPTADRKAFTEVVMNMVVTLAKKRAQAERESWESSKSPEEDSATASPDLSTDDVADLAVGMMYGDAGSDVDVDSLIGDLRSLRDSLLADGVDSTVIDGEPTAARASGVRKTEV
ncbi:PREDICTED: uncharacterized protein LOC109474068 isoform X2 [Branchiostoma belcheri]|uniref:Uncharacterized protein LOC109474068 isoform X2 n=1 Tax=Branchiostoma belcheri TaxID=7741 RepID=A0A6P4ZFH6_BRABE|nr:PREDICTED: uncharacterized protein LOC109474068 isoform X2 [Branchiostoma belcheri]